ncbi:helix-turn-helix transcriptional regulator [candidate division KSB1 bacterium]|nr:helix-turn-helix transcriptional regulator [candidate division KSB1 bacterium]
MLVLVKKPPIEISLNGENVDELVDWIRKKYEVKILTKDNAEELVAIEDTEFWKEMEKNRVGNLLAGARLRAGLTQFQLAEKLGIRQNMISDYENGRRLLSYAMARRFSKILKVREEYLIYKKEHPGNVEK